MRLVSDWRAAWRWFSVQAMALNGAVAAAWLALPQEWRDVFPPEWMTAGAIALMALGVVGRLVTQGGGDA